MLVANGIASLVTACILFASLVFMCENIMSRYSTTYIMQGNFSMKGVLFSYRISYIIITYEELRYLCFLLDLS